MDLYLSLIHISKLNTEISDRKTADQELESKINAEAAARTAQDEVLHQQIVKETSCLLYTSFLSSGNTVFDMADIKAIEDCLSDYPVLKYRFKGT